MFRKLSRSRRRGDGYKVTCLGYAPGDKGLFKAPREVTGAGGAGGAQTRLLLATPSSRSGPASPLGCMLLLPEPPAHAGAFRSPPTGCWSSSCWSSVTGGVSVAGLSQHPLIPISASPLLATRLGQGWAVRCGPLLSPLLGPCAFGCQQGNGTGCREQGEALHPSLPSQHPALEQGNTWVRRSGRDSWLELNPTHLQPLRLSVLISFPPVLPGRSRPRVLCCTPQILLHLAGCPQAASHKGQQDGVDV